MTLSVDFDEYEKAVWGFVIAGSRLPQDSVIFAEQNGPSPSGVYATVLPMDTVQMGTVQTIFRNDGEMDYSILTITASNSIQFFRKGSRNVAELFRAFANSPLGIYEAERRGLTFCRTSQIRDLDSIVSHTWEPRAGLDLEFAYAQRFRNFYPGIQQIDVRFQGRLLEEIRHES